MNKYLILLLSFLFFLTVFYFNEWIAINEPLAYKNFFPLKDVSHDFIPLIDNRISTYTLNGMLIYLTMRLFFIPTNHAISVLVSYFTIAGLLNIARILCILGTKLPPPRNVCSNKPKWQHKWLFIYDENTCGDYMFSGHTVHFILFALLVTFVSDSVVEKIFIWLLSIFGMLTLVGARSHYTIDVIVSICITTLSFFLFKEKVGLLNLFE